MKTAIEQAADTLFGKQPRTAAQRKQAERERKREANLVELRLWLKPKHCELVKRYAAGLKP